MQFRVPNKNDRIAIIGGGPAGSHMSYLLNKKGFNNVTLFEKNQSLGGKSCSIFHDDVIHEMGTCYLSASYIKVIELMTELKDSEYISIPAELRQAWKDTGLITTQRYVSQKIAQTFSALPCKKEYNLLQKFISHFPVIGGLFNKFKMREEILKEIDDYIKYYVKVYPSLKYDIPCLAKAELIIGEKGSMEDLLRDKKLDLLQLIFFMMNTVMCYGYPNTNSPYYGLHWMSNLYLDAYSKFILGKPANINSAMLPGGFQKLWEKAAEASNAKIKYNYNIEKIKRENNLVQIFDGNGEVEEFDFLISAIPASSTLKILDNPTGEEKSLFDCLTYSIVVTTLVTLDSPYKKSGILYWFDNLRAENQDKVFASRTAAAILQKRYNNIQTSVAYQYYDNHQTFDESKAEKHFIDSFERANIKIKNIITRKVWPYFYRYKTEDIQKSAPWRVDNIQGLNNTWYIGSSVCFESVNAVVNFNHYMVDKFLN